MGELCSCLDQKNVDCVTKIKTQFLDECGKTNLNFINFIIKLELYEKK